MVLMGLQVVKSARAAPQVALREVVQVDPGVGRVLLALDHRRGGVVRARVLALGVGVHNARPDECSSLLGLHLNVKVREDRLTALLDVREVQEEGQNARAAGEQLLAPVVKVQSSQKVPQIQNWLNCRFPLFACAKMQMYLQAHIVVIVIELPHIVLQDLEGLVVRGGNVCDLLNLGDGTLHVRIVHAVSSAPSVGAGAALRQGATSLTEGIRSTRVSGSLPGSFHCGDKGSGFFLSKKIVERNNPGRCGDHVHVVSATKPLLNSREHNIHIARLVDRISRYVEETSVAACFVVTQVASIARMRAVYNHPSRIFRALS